MIEVTSLTKRYGETVAVDDLSFTVRRGVVTGFLGPNGAGKSTTMRMILGLDNPSQGRATVNGRLLAEHAAPLTELGALLEARAIHPQRSAHNHLRATATLAARVEAEARVRGAGFCPSCRPCAKPRIVTRNRPRCLRGGGVGGFVANITKLGKEAAMTRNMGTFDRPRRAFVVAPAAIVVTLILGAGTLGGVILFIVAGIMLATAVTAFCPTYTVVGISTEPRLHRVGHHLRGGHA